MTWKKENSERLLKTPYFDVYHDVLRDFNDNEIQYWHIGSRPGVLIVPIRYDKEKESISYVMVRQYRYPTGEMLLEFPKGATLPSSLSKEEDARRELKEETGLDPLKIKFMYEFYAEPSRSNAKTSVYMAMVSGETTTKFAEESELGAGLEVVEVSSDEILKLIRDNEIRDAHTLAALTSVMLQSGEAKRYLDTIEQEE